MSLSLVVSCFQHFFYCEVIVLPTGNFLYILLKASAFPAIVFGHIIDRVILLLYTNIFDENNFNCCPKIYLSLHANDMLR